MPEPNSVVQFFQLTPRALRPDAAGAYLGKTSGSSPTDTTDGSTSAVSDVAAIPTPETRLLRCTVPGCDVSYELLEAKPLPPKSSAHLFLDSLVPQPSKEAAEALPIQGSRYVCSHHPRIGSRCAVFDFLGRTESEFYSTKHGRVRHSAVERDVRFQEHIPHAVFRIDTSTTLHDLVRPNAPPEFLEPTPDELIRLRTASEEYDLRVRASAERNVRLRRCDERPPEVFQWRPTAEQTKEWEQKLHVTAIQSYEDEFRQADIALHKYISQLLRERETATRERQIEIDHHVLHMLRTLPFHPAKPRYAPEIKLLEKEITVARGSKTGDEWTEEVDVFEQIVPNYLPARTKLKTRATMARIKRAWFEDTRARLSRFNKMKNDPEAVRRSKDFKKLLGAVLVLNEDMPAAHAGLLVGETTAAVEKRAQRLRNALHAEETRQVT